MTGERGFKERGGGAVGVYETAREHVATNHTAAGLWPMSRPSTVGLTGAPIGTDRAGRLVFFDPLSSFRSHQIRAAQLGIVAANGVGKSHLGGVMMYAFAAQGVPSIIPCDFKGEWAARVEQLGGRALTVDRSGGLNMLDPGETIAAAHRLNADPTVIRELENRRDESVFTVFGLSRKQPIQELERSILRAALKSVGVGATIHDLPETLAGTTAATTPGLRAVDSERMRLAVQDLVITAASLSESSVGAALGTSGIHQEWPVDSHLSVDTSSIPQQETLLTAATVVSCWTAALSSAYLANELHGHTVKAMIFDEIWRATRKYPALADQIGGLLRMDRHEGIVSVLITHSWKDTTQTEGDNIMNRCAVLALGGMQPQEVAAVAGSGVSLTPQEQAVLEANAAGGSGRSEAYGGTGWFLIKASDGPGIETKIASVPLMPSDTNNRWD